MGVCWAVDCESQQNVSVLAVIVLGMVLLGHFTSSFLEVHIALGFVALFWRMPRLLQFLKRTTLFTWVIALLPVSYFLWVAGKRDISPDLFVGDVYFSVTVATFFSTSALYVTAWFKSWFSPLREE